MIPFEEDIVRAELAMNDAPGVEVPRRLRHLPRDAHGRPHPFFFRPKRKKQRRDYDVIIHSDNGDIFFSSDHSPDTFRLAVLDAQAEVGHRHASGRAVDDGEGARSLRGDAHEEEEVFVAQFG